MNQFAYTCSFAIVLLLGAIALAAPPNGQVALDPTEIPLNKIWAWAMPGTIDIRSLEPTFFGVPIRTDAQLRQAERSLTSQTLMPLSKPAARQPESGFAVKGVGLDALKNAHAVLTGNEQPTNSFTPEDDVTIVFFSHVSGTYVHLNRVSRQRDRIEIRYEFVPHIDAELTFHLALIPLGKLPTGQFKARTVLAPLDKKYSPLADESALKELANHSVCKSFQFVVRDMHQGE